MHAAVVWHPQPCLHIKEEVREDLYMQAGLQVSSILLSTSDICKHHMHETSNVVACVHPPLLPLLYARTLQFITHIHTCNAANTYNLPFDLQYLVPAVCILKEIKGMVRAGWLNKHY
jgi:hypothetical protein